MPDEVAPWLHRLDVGRRVGLHGLLMLLLQLVLLLNLLQNVGVGGGGGVVRVLGGGLLLLPKHIRVIDMIKCVAVVVLGCVEGLPHVVAASRLAALVVVVRRAVLGCVTGAERLLMIGLAALAGVFLILELAFGPHWTATLDEARGVPLSCHSLLLGVRGRRG